MEQQMFGGAIVGIVPADAQDLSIVRQIPDNQEVYAHSQTDQSVIVEILEYVQEADEEAIKTHFSELASSNDANSADSCCILGVDQLDKHQTAMKECSAAYWLMGQQRVAKFKESVKNELNVHMVLFRLPQFTTDIVITFNDPVNINPDSSSHHAVATNSAPWTIDDIRKLAHSLTIVNPALFG